MQLVQGIDAVRDAAAIELDRGNVQRFVIADGQRGHGETVRSRRGIEMGLERLPPGRDVEHAIPLHGLAGGKHGIEMSAMEGVEGAAADADSHSAGCWRIAASSAS